MPVLFCWLSVLICFDPNAGKAAVSWKWVLFAALSFLGNGMCSVVQKMEGEALGSVYRDEFMIAALLMILPVFGVWGLIREKSAARMFFRRGWYWGALCGVLNGGVNLSVLMLAQSMPASLQFPLISAGSVLLSLLISVFCYRERLSARQLVGAAVGILSVICLNL